MHFYVPTIGDSIYLTKPWTFVLHQERRNMSLAKKLEQCGQTETRYHIYRKIRYNRDSRLRRSWIGIDEYDHRAGDERELYVSPPVDYENGQFSLQSFCRRNHWLTEDITDLGEVLRPYNIYAWNNRESTVTLPIATQLIVDRIYIRGRSRDFDSITYRIGTCPEKKLQKSRFWVKLRDANKIVCDLTPVVDEEAKKLHDALSRFAQLEE